ncbi:hypothetical protein PHYSODRAFT_311514 [Phytophthora sojae]|uniref:Uncharacterized protein n=1 Tax=Phytophthora sojae (strain P6497) TaxID=1094619 RepID=G4YZF3_PHYSP|nr:hypothetical protein PHYSODRAFT_311514 [Phytophthora sojae]EGZ24628.1 hypothetical protein PHYSODRAFT_311514 [Phytophthora sojae]|eukprot:XP_009519916.1 hypothetical protein PHYSODRAFT_311514 [Phytophthora sojae]
MGGNYSKLFTKFVAERALARHRLVRRNTQRRYRKKLQNKGIDLETSVTQLRAEIQRLQQMKSEPQHILIAMTPWKAIVEQSRLFRYGFRPPVPVSELCSDKTPQCSDLAYVQTRFTQTIMAPDVHNNAGYGVKAGLENWRLISLHHENLVIELVRLERGPGESVVAYQNATTTFTANMLRQALPHLVDDERGWDPVAVKLIGQKLVVPGTLRFDWDPSTNKVVRTHYEIDMLTSLLALLGSVEDVSSVLDSALAIDYWSTTTCR